MKRLLLILGLLCLTGCGYTTRSALPARLQAIYIQPFKNEVDYTTSRQRSIYIPLLESKVRDAVINRFLFDGNLKIAEEQDADLILNGKIKAYERTALRYTDDDDVQEYRIHIVIDMVLSDTAQQEPLWEELGFTGEATYFVTGALATSESAAIEEATTDLARRVVERTIENW